MENEEERSEIKKEVMEGVEFEIRENSIEMK